jgi:hypothetical protein
VRDISGMSTMAWRSRSSTLSMARRKTSVLPLAVTPKRRKEVLRGASSAAAISATADRCSGVSSGGGPASTATSRQGFRRTGVQRARSSPFFRSARAPGEVRGGCRGTVGGSAEAGGLGGRFGCALPAIAGELLGCDRDLDEANLVLARPRGTQSSALCNEVARLEEAECAGEALAGEEAAERREPHLGAGAFEVFDDGSGIEIGADGVGDWLCGEVEGSAGAVVHALGQEGAQRVSQLAEIAVGHPSGEGECFVGEHGNVFEDRLNVLEVLTVGVIPQPGHDADDDTGAKWDEHLGADAESALERLRDMVGKELTQGAPRIWKHVHVARHWHSGRLGSGEGPRRQMGVQPPAALRSCSAMSVRSHSTGRSVRPKWP